MLSFEVNKDVYKSTAKIHKLYNAHSRSQSYIRSWTTCCTTSHSKSN